MEGPSKLGQRVRSHRMSLGLSQQELARRARLSQPRISQIERGEMDGPLPARTLRDLADALAVDLESLTDGDPWYESSDLDDERSPDSLPSTFPSPTLPLIGRGDALVAIGSLIQSSNVRLVSLTGPGGIGKTHLAVRAVKDLEGIIAERITVVSLAASTDAAQVTSAIAHALGLRERDERPLRTRLLDALRFTPRLLLLDNLEQALPSAATLVADLLAACPNLKVLVTSRARLRVRGEQEYAVPPLALPELLARQDIDAIAASPAVQLFIQRAAAVVYGFELTEANAEVVAAICRRLDGLPLAIELAAARTKAFTPEQMLQRLEQRIPFLTGLSRDLPVRHLTMRNAIAWSYDLLESEERMLFRQLAIFAGGFTLEAAEQVMSHWSPARVADGVVSFLDQSLLTRVERPKGTLRFGMLETVRDYALEQLGESGELEDIARRHLVWSMELAERAEQHLFGAGETLWLDRLDLEYANLRAALAWAAANGEPETGARLAAALTDYWYLRGYLSEGRQWLSNMLALLEKSGETSAGLATARVRTLAAASQLAAPQGDMVVAVSYAQESLALARTLDYRPGMARALVLLANRAQIQGDFTVAESLHHEALALLRDMIDLHSWTVAELNNLGILAFVRHDDEQAIAFANEAIEVANVFADSWGLSIALRTLGDVALRRGAIGDAAGKFIESLDVSRESGSRWGIANSLAAFGSLAVALGEMEQAITCFASAKTLYDALGIRVPPAFRPDWTESIARAKSETGEERFRIAWATGARLTLADAVRNALDWAGSHPDQRLRSNVCV